MARDKRRADIAKFLKAYRDFGAPAGSAAEQTIWIILQRHGSKEGATGALKALWRRFVDINEFRVAKGSETGAVIQRYVKNDPYRVADEARGFLRRFHRDQHTVDFGITESMSVEQLRKYLSNVKSHLQPLALALFVHYCLQEEAAESAAAVAEAEPKAKKRPEKEITLAAERLRLLAAVAAAGQVVAKTRQTSAARNLEKAWSYSPLPEPAPVAAASGHGKASKVKAANKGGGAARPRTTRTARTRSTKSSRR